MQTKSNYTLITNKRGLELAAVSFNNSRQIAIDTESSGYYTYVPRVCLIQITCTGKNYIIDPLSGIDLRILGDIFENPKVLKIFHSAIDDIKALKRDFSFKFKNIADTMYSSKLLALEHNSLNFLAEYYLKIKLSKTEQKSNWEKRPLDRSQLEYASLDTAYLETIWSKMKTELETQGLLEEAESEFSKFCDEVYKPRETEEIAWHKFPNVMKFTPEQRRTVHDILQYREEKAKRLNKASFRIVNNEIIKKIATEKHTEESLLALLGKKEGKDVFDLLQNPSGPPLEKKDIPKLDENMTPAEEVKLRHFHKWRDKIMKKRNIDHSMLLSNRQFLQILRTKPADLEALEKLEILSGWKVKNYGPSFLKMLKGDPYDDLINHLKPIGAKVEIRESKTQVIQTDSAQP